MISDKLIRGITARYIIALSLIASVLTASFFMLKTVISQQEATAAIVNVSGRQRMLSQRIALFSKLMVSENSSEQKLAYRNTLIATVNLIELSHYELTAGSEEMGLPASMSPAVGSMYYHSPHRVDSVLKNYVQNARQLIDEWETAQGDHRALAYITKEGPEKVLFSLNLLVDQYQLEGEEQVAKILQDETLVWLIALVILALEARFIFRPMAKRVHSQLRSLEQAQQIIEKEKAEQELLYQELQRSQSQLIQSRTMSAVGQLAAGAAHEINNPLGFLTSNVKTVDHYIRGLLSIIDTYAEFENMDRDRKTLAKKIRRKKEQIDFDFLADDATELVEESRIGLERISAITRSLLTFSEHESQVWESCDLSNLLDAAIDSVASGKSSGININQNYKFTGTVHGISAYLHQLFANILRNSIESFDDQGSISIHTSGSSEEAIVEIADDGSGISDENMSKVFDPFFTTRPIGSGVGLGLSFAYNIVASHRGKIELFSKPESGTRVRISLPLSRADLDPKKSIDTVNFSI